MQESTCIEQLYQTIYILHLYRALSFIKPSDHGELLRITSVWPPVRTRLLFGRIVLDTDRRLHSCLDHKNPDRLTCSRYPDIELGNGNPDKKYFHQGAASRHLFYMDKEEVGLILTKPGRLADPTRLSLKKSNLTNW